MGIRHELPPEYLEDMSNRKLSTFDGVFMYVAVSVFGVVLFARMGTILYFDCAF
jgi:amino acid transporter